jgi:hypothetical protein
VLIDIYSEVTSVQNWTDIQSISLPIQRELVDLKLEICQLLTNMLEVELDQVIYKNVEDLNKDRVIKVRSLFKINLLIKNFVLLQLHITVLLQNFASIIVVYFERQLKITSNPFKTPTKSNPNGI